MAGPKVRRVGSTEDGRGSAEKSVVIAKVRVEPSRHEKYMRALRERAREAGMPITFTDCVREALDQWSDGVLGRHVAE